MNDQLTLASLAYVAHLKEHACYSQSCPILNALEMRWLALAGVASREVA